MQSTTNQPDGDRPYRNPIDRAVITEDEAGDMVYHLTEDLGEIMSWAITQIRDTHPDHLPFKLNDLAFWMEADFLGHFTDEDYIQMSYGGQLFGLTVDDLGLEITDDDPDDQTP